MERERKKRKYKSREIWGNLRRHQTPLQLIKNYTENEVADNEAFHPQSLIKLANLESLLLALTWTACDFVNAELSWKSTLC